jgi:protoporphyrinogen oxidase
MKHISILGGGMAGLAVGYFAKKRNLPVTIYEAKEHPGGNCATLRRGEFLFDLGAHRFHDKDGQITELLQKLLGADLKKIDAPSAIFHRGQFIHFPLSPFDLLKKLGYDVCLRAACQVVRAKFICGSSAENFADQAIRSYGRIIAGAFLLNYTEKLYGKTCSLLSPSVAGQRLKGLNLRTFLTEAFSRKGQTASHMEGAFYYPKQGIGAIADSLSDFCGLNNIRTGAKATKIIHNRENIQKVEINGRDLIEIEELVSTLPIDYFLKAMKPAPPATVLSALDRLKFRSLVLVAVFLDKASITPYATVYFPENRFPQTRTYEPRNRSSLMSPQGKTCLVSEIPCQRNDDVWNLDDRSIVQTIVAHLMDIRWLSESDIIDTAVVRLDYAYPILTIGHEEYLKVIMDYLSGFKNLRLSGRNATFTYSWIHNMLSSGKEIIRSYLDESGLKEGL